MKAWIAVGLFLAAPLVYAQKTNEIAVPVTAAVEVRDVQERNYPGRVVAVAQVNLTARVSGEILEVGFRNGEVVKAGQLLYRLDSVKYEAAVKNAEAKVAEYQARIAYAQRNYDRNRLLSESQAVSRDTLENAQSELKAYQAALAAAEADLAAAKDDLFHCRILSPIDGKIGTNNYTVGNYVTGSSGTLATLVQTMPIRIRFSISNRDFLDMFGGRTKNICAGGEVALTLADGSAFPEKGKIEYVDNSADESTDTMRVFALVDNKNRVLKPGGTIGVTLKNTAGSGKPAVPPSAVRQDVMGAFVWVVDADNTARKRYVVRGRVTQDLQLIESGLKVGERIVVEGTHKVRAGDRIQPVTEK